MANKNISKPTLILHIGTPKTGTTTIQNSLIKNQAYLKEIGLFIGNSSPFISDLIRINSGYTFKKNDIRYDNHLPLETCYNIYMDQFIKSGCKSAIISKESMFIQYTNKENHDGMKREIKRLFNYFDIKVVCYLRRQDIFLESFYNQQIKGNGSQPFERPNSLNNSRWFADDKDISHFKSFINKNFQLSDYIGNISGWSDVFGKENIIIRPFEKSQLKNGLLYDFYSNSFNFSDEEISKLESIDNHNAGMCRDILEFKRLISIDDFYMFECVNNIMNNKNTNQSFFTNDERKEFMAFHEEGNSILAREHLGREDGKLFYDEVEDSPTYSGLSLEKATEIGNIIMALSNYNSPWDTIKLGDCSSVEEVIESAKEVYFDKVDEKYTIRKLQTLFNMLNGEEKKVLIYGVFGDLASRVFNVADAYKRCIKIYVSDKSLNNKKSYNGYSVVNFNEIESLSPDIILISAKFSGKDIKSYLSKLNLPTSAICPVYDFSDKIWENIIPSFFTRVSPNVL